MLMSILDVSPTAVGPHDWLIGRVGSTSLLELLLDSWRGFRLPAHRPRQQCQQPATGSAMRVIVIQCEDHMRI